MVYFYEPSFAALTAPAVTVSPKNDSAIGNLMEWPILTCHGRRVTLEKGLRVEAHPDHYTISADLPGFKAEEIKVELLGCRRIAVSAETSQASPTHLDDTERTEGRRVSRKLHRTFRQLVKLPNDVEEGGGSAQVEHGVLRVTLPRRKGFRSGPRTIPVLAGGVGEYNKQPAGAKADGNDKKGGEREQALAA